MEFCEPKPGDWRPRTGTHRPVTFREWSRIATNPARKRLRRHGAPRPIGSRPGYTVGAPAARLANGQSVTAAILSRNAGTPTLAETLTDAGYPYAVAYGGAAWPPVAPMPCRYCGALVAPADAVRTMAACDQCAGTVAA